MLHSVWDGPRPELWPCLWCTRICIGSASMVLFRSGKQGHVVSYCPPAVVCLLSDVQPVNTCHRNQPRQRFEDFTTQGRTELVMKFQVPEPTLWVAKGSYGRFQFELSTGTSTTFAERHLSCRPMAVRFLSCLQYKTLTNLPSGY